MTPTSIPHQRSRWRYVALTLLMLSVIGIWNGYEEWAGAVTPGQRIATFTEIGYGILGPISAIAVSNGWRPARWLLGLWTLCLAVTSGLAPVVWGDAPLWSGILAGVAAALLGVWVIWMSRQPKRASHE